MVGCCDRWPGDSIVETEEQRQEELLECLAYFTRLWQERQEQGLSNDFISMLAHGEATKDMAPEEYLGNLVLLIVGGNDTTRNSMTGGVLALNENPGEYAKLRNNSSVIPNMVSEIIRWQTPLAHMRRIANRDYEINGQTIKQGDKVIMWYLSGNRDERAIENPNEFIIDRARAAAFVIWIWSPSVYGKSSGRTAVAHSLGRDSTAFSHGGSGWRCRACTVKFRAWLTKMPVSSASSVALSLYLHCG